MTYTAHDIAAYHELYNRVVTIGRNEWECMGYSRTGRTVIFARLVETKDGRFKQINKYVPPMQEVIIKESRKC